MTVTMYCLALLASVTTSAFAMINDGYCKPRTACHDCARTYTIDHKHIAIPQGCYNSRGNLQGNALPYSSISNHRDGQGIDILWEMWGCTGDATQIIAEFCGKEAVAKGKPYFGVEFYGECYFGDEQDIDKSQGLVTLDECDDRCQWDVGGADTMMIYKVEDVLAGYRCPS